MKLHPPPNNSLPDPYQESPDEMYVITMIPANENEEGGEASPPFTPLQTLMQHGLYCEICGTTFDAPMALIHTLWGTVECLKCIYDALVPPNKCSIEGQNPS